MTHAPPPPTMSTRRKRVDRWRGRSAALLTGLALAGWSAGASAAVDKSLCVFDPGGANGDLYNQMSTYTTDAIAWGVNFKLVPYTNEAIAAADFRNKKCDAVVLTGLTGKEFNPKTYTLEAMGLFDSYAELKTAVNKLAHPALSRVNTHTSGGVNYETAGVYPGGAVYLYLRDRKHADLSALSGRSIATIANDPAAQTMVTKVGAIAKRAEIANFASMFNNGSVDVCYAPATAYGPLELARGIGKPGGVVRFPIAQITFQIYIRSDEFPADFGKNSRTKVAGDFSTMERLILREEERISTWIDVPPESRKTYDSLLDGVRQSLSTQNVYSATVLKLIGGT